MKTIVLSILILLLTSMQIMAQKNKADNQFRQYQYTNAIPLYEKCVKNTPNDYVVLKRLGICYLKTNNINRASEIYKTIVSLKESNPNDLYQYIQILRTQQNIKEANVYAVKYKSLTPGPRADKLLAALEMYYTLISTQNDYTISNKTAQYPFSVYAPVRYSDKFIVTSDKNESGIDGRKYTDLFIADNTLSDLKPFAKEVMIKFDDGTPAFTDNGNTMYYTTTFEDYVVEGDLKTQKLKINIAVFNGKKWELTKEFQYNSKLYKTAHPAISSDGNMFVFASDMPGGKGGMDLYICTRQGNEWSKPQNLSALNTQDNELFPSFNANNDLIFSSNGLPGLGGLDLFIAKRNNSGFDAPINLRAPLNSVYDDFCLSTNDDFNTGYLSSNRFGNGVDNILMFEKSSTKHLAANSEKILNIVVVDKYTKSPLPYVFVTIKNMAGNIVHKGLTDENGNIDIDELPADAYTIQGELNDVTTNIATVSKSDFNGKPFSIELNHNDPRFTMKGVVINSKNNKPVDGVTVTCKNLTSGTEKTVITKTNGQFFFQLEQKSDFKVSGQKSKWLSSESEDETTKGLNRSKELYVKLTLNLQQPSSDATIRLNKIYYDYNKSDIKPAAEEELNRLVTLLNDYPDMIIELSSHTDSRGSDSYNMILSQKRADAALAYIISKGINKKRIHAKGYGETRLLNKCANDIPCTEEMHQENRRTEFKIILCASCPNI